MAYSEKIIDAAKNLYLTINDRGQRKYSYDEIIQELSKIFTKKKIGKITKRTVINWSKKESWEASLQAVKSLGQQKAIMATADKEKTLIDAISDDIAERRIKAKEIKDKADLLLLMTLDKMIESGVNEIDLRTLQQISTQSENIIQNLDRIKTPESSIDSKLERVLALYDMG